MSCASPALKIEPNAMYAPLTTKQNPVKNWNHSQTGQNQARTTSHILSGIMQPMRKPPHSTNKGDGLCDKSVREKPIKGTEMPATVPPDIDAKTM